MTVYVKDLVDNLRIECAYSTEELLKNRLQLQILPDQD